MHFDPIVRAIVDICILIAFAKVLAGLMNRFNMPEVLGELFAGIILGPFALGSLQIAGEPLVAFNEHVIAFGEIGAILILFVAGLEVGCGISRPKRLVTGTDSRWIGSRQVCTVPRLLISRLWMRI